MIDALFGSKTRVKLLHLFLNNPGKSFYVREITRLIGEQINSVRRELSNMLDAGVLLSNTNDNKLYYEINRSYIHYKPLKEIFTNNDVSKQKPKRFSKQSASSETDDWRIALAALPKAKIVIAAGVLVRGSASKVDLLIVGNVESKRVADVVDGIEIKVGRQLTFSRMLYDEFYYRLSVHDRFINDILSSRHEVVVDSENILQR